MCSYFFSLQFIACSIYGLFQWWCTSSMTNLASVSFTENAPGVFFFFFAAVYEYIHAPLHLLLGAPNPFPSPSFTSSLFFSACFLIATILAKTKTSRFFWSHTSSHTSQHGTKDAQTNMRTPVQHSMLQGECCWHKFEPTGVILGGMAQVSYRSTLLFIDTSPGLQICW